MPTFKIISGTVPAKIGFFISPFGKDQISIQTGLIKSKELVLADASVDTEGLHAPDKKTTRFYLKDSADEWLCECSSKDFSKLQEIVLKQKYKKIGVTQQASTTGEHVTQSGFAHQIGQTIATDKKSNSLSSIAKAFVAGLIGIGILAQCTKSDGPKHVDKVITESQGEKKSSLLNKMTHGENANLDKLGSASSPTELKKNLRSKISDDVFTPYTRSGYSKTFAKYGSRMQDVEKARQSAAFLAVTSSKCSWVEISEVATNSTRDNIETFTDCRDKSTDKFERFRFQEKELKDKKGQFFTENTVTESTKATTIQEQSMSKDAALIACREMVKQSAKFPSSVSFSTFGAISNTSQATGETWVELDFEAKNGLGAMLPYKANCGFPINGSPTFEFKAR